MSETASTDTVAVLTGDLVRSRSLVADDLERGLQEIHRTIADVEELHPYLRATPVDVFRGDAWQLVLFRPGLALELALLIRARLRSMPDTSGPIDTRVAIGIGPVTSVDPDRASRGRGVAFELSGAALDGLEDGRRMAGALSTPARGLDSGSLSTILALLDALTRRWSARQARAVAGGLVGRTQSQIGERWTDGRISQQAVAQHLEAASWDAVEFAVDYFRGCWPDTLGAGGSAP